MESCVKNIRTKNYQNIMNGFHVTVKNVRDVFETQCTYRRPNLCGAIKCHNYNVSIKNVSNVQKISRSFKMQLA